MVEIKCDNCGKIINRKKSKVERSEKHFCSMACRCQAQCKAKRAHTINGNCILLEVTKEKTAIFDLIDKDLAEFNWQSQKGYVNRKGTDNKYIFMHRVVMERILGRPLLDNEEVDHINGNRLDNRRANLRPAIHSKNCSNMKKSNKKSTSKYKGVSFDEEKNKWHARITFNGLTQNLGYFENEKEAAIAYDKAAIDYFGNFAKLNFEREDYAREVHRQAGSACAADV